MTIAQQMRLAGFMANRTVRGRPMAPFAGATQGSAIQGIVQEAPMLMDMEHPAMVKNPIYVWIHVLAGDVADPRAVTQFNEIAADGTATGKQYFVIGYEETAADVVIWKWKCEAQRQ